MAAEAVRTDDVVVEGYARDGGLRPGKQEEKTQPASHDDDVLTKEILGTDGKPQPAKIMVMIGTCASGKSYLLKAFLYQHCFVKPYYSFGYVCSGTEFTKNYDYLPKEWRHKFEEEGLHAYVEKLREARSRGDKPLRPNLLVIDDLQSSALTRLFYNSTGGWFEGFLTTHRHTNTTVIILSQSMRGFSTFMRSLANIAVMFNTSNHEDMKALYKNFGNQFEHFKVFKQYFEKATSEQYQAMMMIQGKRKIEDTFFMYKAPSDIPEKFQIAKNPLKPDADKPRQPVLVDKVNAVGVTNQVLSFGIGQELEILLRGLQTHQ